MPSVLLGNPVGSGAQIIVSGCYWSGKVVPYPVGGVQLKWDSNASGYAYVGFSGGLNVNSGGMFLSGTSGLMDGMQLARGDYYFVPKMAFISGQLNIYAWCDAACSGQGRLYWEVL